MPPAPTSLQQDDRASSCPTRPPRQGIAYLHTQDQYLVFLVRTEMDACWITRDGNQVNRVSLDDFEAHHRMVTSEDVEDWINAGLAASRAARLSRLSEGEKIA